MSKQKWHYVKTVFWAVVLIGELDLLYESITNESYLRGGFRLLAAVVFAYCLFTEIRAIKNGK